MNKEKRTAAQEATQAIERIYITMRHLFNRGFYKPMGVSGTTLREGLLQLKPEIYGSIAEDKLELNGLIYVLDRLPEGIEECKVINLTSSEGFDHGTFKPIIPAKRRRNCYRIDEEQMNIEITRGRSDIYDVLTHLTFLFVESHKIASRAIMKSLEISRDWLKLEHAVKKSKLTKEELEIALVYAATIIGRTFDETLDIHQKLSTKQQPNRFLKTIYWLGKNAIDEIKEKDNRSITFSPILRERLGHHLHGEIWANNLKKILLDNHLLHRPLHIISANMHSVMNYLYAKQALGSTIKDNSDIEIFELLSQPGNETMRHKIEAFAQKHGMISYNDTSGTNIDVQLFDMSKIKLEDSLLRINKQNSDDENPVLFVMDYAFGEQAFETMDELLKPYKVIQNEPINMNVVSISIMGKAGILVGEKGDIMIPDAHIFEGTADNYPFKNELSKSDFEESNLGVSEGSMISVLGTSLQNKEMLMYFKKSSWRVIGLEMEGAHYQKAIQAASKIRRNISENVKVRYAYYASDNPLETGSTLASGGLGLTGVLPTYLITQKILEQILR
jgi:hypothetical protein